MTGDGARAALRMLRRRRAEGWRDDVLWGAGRLLLEAERSGASTTVLADLRRKLERAQRSNDPQIIRDLLDALNVFLHSEMGGGNVLDGLAGDDKQLEEATMKDNSAYDDWRTNLSGQTGCPEGDDDEMNETEGEPVPYTCAACGYEGTTRRVLRAVTESARQFIRSMYGFQPSSTVDRYAAHMPLRETQRRGNESAAERFKRSMGLR